jgi:protease IV
MEDDVVPASPSTAKELAALHDTQEALIRDLLAERKADRRKGYIKYGIIGALGLAYLGAFMVGIQQSDAGMPADTAYVALVKVSGEIMPDKEASALNLNPLLERAFQDTRAKGVALLINSPGGTPVQSALIHEQIRALRVKYPDKKVIAVGEDLMTSGAYMIASAADQIVVNRSTIAGSIGVVSRGFGFTGLIEKLGVERRVMTAGEAKNMLDPFVAQTDRDREKQAELLSSIHAHFIDVVKDARGSRLQLDTPGLFSGAVWTGEAAVHSGLADKLGSLESVMRDDFKVTTYKEYAKPMPLMQMLASTVGVKVAESLQPVASATPVLMPN